MLTFWLYSVEQQYYVDKVSARSGAEIGNGKEADMRIFLLCTGLQLLPKIVAIITWETGVNHFNIRFSQFYPIVA